MGKNEQLDPKMIHLANYPSRKIILQKLKSGPIDIAKLQKAVKMSQKVFGSYLGQLRDADLVKVERDSVSITAKGKEILAYVEKLDMENIDWT